MICKDDVATRMCNQCEQKNHKIKWGDGLLHTCFVCYSTFHNESAEMKKHAFTVTKKPVAKPLSCCICGTFATRRCRGMVIPESTKDKLTTVITEAFSDGGYGKAKDKGVGILDQIEEEEFLNVVKDNLGLGNLFSDERIKSIYLDCRGKFKEKRSNPEIWKRFQEHLNAIGDECDENYCEDCWESTHSRGKRSKHQWVGFMEGCRVCVECEILPAEKYCEVCEDDYCANCAKDTHRHGKKHKHTFQEVRSKRGAKRRAYSNNFGDENRANLGFCTRRALLPIAAIFLTHNPNPFCDSLRSSQITEPLEPQQVHCKHCEFRVATEQCKFCKKFMCNSCNAFGHPDECTVRIKLTGGKTKGQESHAITCAVCEKPPDVQCQQCGDVYCSVKWMGNPGCFRKTHMKGNRKEHTCVPYTFLEDRMKHEEELARKAKEKHDVRVAKMNREKELREAMQRSFMEKAAARQRNLELDAQKEFEERHTGRLKAAAAKKWSKYLPKIMGGGKKDLSKGKILNMPTVEKMNEQMKLAKERFEQEVQNKLKMGPVEEVNPHAPPIENVLIRQKKEAEEAKRLKKIKEAEDKVKEEDKKKKEDEEERMRRVSDPPPPKIKMMN